MLQFLIWVAVFQSLIWVAVLQSLIWVTVLQSLNWVTVFQASPGSGSVYFTQVPDLGHCVLVPDLGQCISGKSLIWVSVLGTVVMYQFALAAFAFLRYAMDVQREDASLFCGTLFQCTATVLRYGLVGEIFEVLKSRRK